MNITSQTLINQKIKNALPFQSIQTSSSRLRLKEARRVLNGETKPFEVKSFKVKNVSFDMICCPIGTFTMGADDQNNNPKRKERIVHPFLLGETEVTQDLYKTVMDSNPSQFKVKGGKKKPVENVSWYDAVMFCNKLSKILGRAPYYHISNIKQTSSTIYSADVVISYPNANGFRLPTEKEWEYAAKAGTENKWSGNDNKNELDQYAWFSKNSKNETHPVKLLKPNEWGLYDMSGNVFEWCWDAFREGRVIRGGNWGISEMSLRSAVRFDNNAGEFKGKLGFRISAYL